MVEKYGTLDPTEITNEKQGAEEAKHEGEAEEREEEEREDESELGDDLDDPMPPEPDVRTNTAESAQESQPILPVMPATNILRHTAPENVTPVPEKRANPVPEKMTNMVNLTIPNITVSETTPTIPTNRATITEAERKEETTTQEKSRLTHHKHGGEKRRHSDGQAPGAYKRRSPTGRFTQVNMEQEEEGRQETQVPKYWREEHLPAECTSSATSCR